MRKALVISRRGQLPRPHAPKGVVPQQVGLPRSKTRDGVSLFNTHHLPERIELIGTKAIHFLSLQGGFNAPLHEGVWPASHFDVLADAVGRLLEGEDQVHRITHGDRLHAALAAEAEQVRPDLGLHHDEEPRPHQIERAPDDEGPVEREIEHAVHVLHTASLPTPSILSPGSRIASPLGLEFWIGLPGFISFSSGRSGVAVGVDVDAPTGVGVVGLESLRQHAYSEADERERASPGSRRDD